MIVIYNKPLSSIKFTLCDENIYLSTISYYKSQIISHTRNENSMTLPYKINNLFLNFIINSIRELGRWRQSFKLKHKTVTNVWNVMFHKKIKYVFQDKFRYKNTGYVFRVRKNLILYSPTNSKTWFYFIDIFVVFIYSEFTDLVTELNIK